MRAGVIKGVKEEGGEHRGVKGLKRDGGRGGDGEKEDYPGQRKTRDKGIMRGQAGSETGERRRGEEAASGLWVRVQVAEGTGRAMDPCTVRATITATGSPALASRDQHTSKDMVNTLTLARHLRNRREKSFLKKGQMLELQL